MPGSGATSPCAATASRESRRAECSRSVRDANASTRTGSVVAPGFIDIQAQSYDNFMTGDGRALSMVTQGITTAILGEGDTPAPVNDKLLAAITDTAARNVSQRFTGPHGFGQWLDFMQRRGLSENVGSFVGSGTVRAYAKGAVDGGVQRAPSATPCARWSAAR